MIKRTTDLKAPMEHDAHPGEAHKPVPCVFVGGNALLRAGFTHLLAGTRFQVLDPAGMNGPATIPEGSDLVLLMRETGESARETAEAVRRIKAEHPAVRVCLLAEQFDAACILEAREAKADGFCLTTVSRDVMVASLELIMLGESFIPSTLLEKMLEQMASKANGAGTPAWQESKVPPPAAFKLSARESEILRSLMEGEPNKIIARRFGVTEATVKVHVKAILRKIGAKNRTQAAMWATHHIAAPSNAPQQPHSSGAERPRP